jgi:hypothetical protein
MLETSALSRTMISTFACMRGVERFSWSSVCTLDLRTEDRGGLVHPLILVGLKICT